MAHPARTALVLQGGGALGAYELGAALRFHREGARRICVTPNNLSTARLTKQKDPPRVDATR